MFRRLMFLATFLCLSGVAHADPQGIATYAIVVGSNAGGPGQTDLRYAEDDARRVGALLVELGGYTADQVDVVVHPTPDQLRERLQQLVERVTADLGAGRQSRIFFYYSGHARASAIDLGSEELPLEELRQRLFQVPATLTVVVLDACQSGAFSRIKGAQPAADFSYNSRQHLDATGVAVLASSSGSELSQESEQLKSSYFTHHLLVGLRGAGDANGDGEVSIDEAYRYAYHQTLLATASTAVGGQHVTFEADLKGHGEVPLSFPRAATQTIELPAPLEGQATVEDKRAHAVVAEIYKAKGAPVRIAVAPGEYEVLVRHGDSLARCEVNGGGVVELDHCRTEVLRTNLTKGLGGGFVPATRIELTLVVGNERQDAYTTNLTNFGYSQDIFAVSDGLELLGLRQLSPRLWVGGMISHVTMPDWTSSVTGPGNLMQELDWSITTIAPVVRGEQRFAQAGWLSRFSAYGQLIAGLGIGRTTLTDTQDMHYTDTTFGPSFGVGAGLHLESPRGLGLSAGYELDYAPAITDRIGNTHAAGGDRATFALSYRF